MPDEPILESADSGDSEPDVVRELQRTFAVEDIHVRTDDGDGRTVEAYAAVFDQETEIRDLEGHYFEVIRKGAFGRSIAAHERGEMPIRVLFNHGRSLFGAESDRFAMPLGKPIEVKEDGRGLYTKTRYARTELADEVLELIRDGVVTHQSVTFSRTANGGGTRRHNRSGRLPLAERLDVRLFEYGPAMNRAAYPGAKVLAVRTIAETIHKLTPAERAELIEALEQTSENHLNGDSAERTSPESPVDELLIRNHELVRARMTT